MLSRQAYTYMLIHLRRYHATKLGGSAIITSYSASLELHLGARIQGSKIKFTSIQPLDKRSLIIVFGGILVCTLEGVYKIL